MQRIGERPLTPAERQKRYREAHPEKTNTAKNDWRRANPGKYREGRNRRTRAYELRNPERSKIKNARFRRTVHGISCYLYWNSKRRAQVNGLEFTLTKEWIESAVTEGKCQITDLPFSLENGRKPWAPSLDKINPLGGYTPENVKVVVWMYNCCKAEFGHEDVIKFAKAVLKSERGNLHAVPA